MPFIGKVLEQVEPYMEEMLITISAKSSDETWKVIEDFKIKYGNKIRIFTENVEEPSHLTGIRNEQVKDTNSDWILFLDDDDYWAKDQLELCLAELDKDPEMLGYAVSPYQLVDFEHYDDYWLQKKFFTKFLRQKGLQYIKPWPRDLPADKNASKIYWKTHPKCKVLPYHYYHLSALKDSSFRNEEWAKKFTDKKGNIIKLDKPLKI